MRNPLLSLVCFVLVSAPLAARAQSPDAVGIRAQGMAGAFTAVADDATATWWNPAGLATGAYLNTIVEYGRDTDLDRDHRGFALAFPALGLSYYRMTISEIRPPTSTGSSIGDRQDPGTPTVRSVDFSQFGATFGQSVGRYLVVASTFKLARALGDSQAGLDVGAIAAVGHARFGVTVRNLRELTFNEGLDPLKLKRQARAGVALSGTGRGVFGGATLAFDADLTRTPTATGNERRVGGGGEIWTVRRILGVRGGVSASTIGDRRTALSGGVSVALRQGLYFDGQLTGGPDNIRRGWGTALRLTF